MAAQNHIDLWAAISSRTKQPPSSEQLSRADALEQTARKIVWNMPNTCASALKENGLARRRLARHFRRRFQEFCA